jgi:hypothetical protein
MKLHNLQVYIRTSHDIDRCRSYVPLRIFGDSDWTVVNKMDWYACEVLYPVASIGRISQVDDVIIRTARPSLSVMQGYTFIGVREPYNPRPAVL